MREIKFRGKNYDGIWLYGYLMPAEKPVINKGCKYRISASPQACAGKDKMVYEVITATVGRFTGLKDKNGWDIYEGDILRSDDYPYSFAEEKDNYYAVVWWSDDNAAFVAETRVASHAKVRGVSNGNCEYLGELLLKEEDSAFELIGNIHDNPELLKS
jgi:uncharacterized phage protein (TIGR01671 family)